LDDFGAGFGMRKQSTARDNAKALQAAIDYAFQRGGGIVMIPLDDGTLSLLNYYPISPSS
jgi:polygalacturonase